MEWILKNWWIILLVGGFAYLMFRGGGCGMGHRDESHEGHHATDPGPQTEGKNEARPPRRRGGCC